MRISELKILNEDMNEVYEDLQTNIDIFFQEPTVENKKYIREKVKEFNHIKNVFMNKIQDFWCKGE